MKITGKINKNNYQTSKTKKIHCQVLSGALLLICTFLSSIFLSSCGLFYYSSRQDDLKQSIQETSDILENGKIISGEGTSGTLSNEKSKEPKINQGSTFSVKEIIDGDTFSISNGQKVRLIGINTA